MAYRTKKRMAAWNLVKDQVKASADKIINAQEPQPFGHGFLWAVIDDGTLKLRTLLTSGCVTDWRMVQTMVESLPGVEYTTVNLD